MFFPNSSFADSINQHVERGYNELLQADLITDPIVETTLALVILPFVPIFHREADQKRQVIYRKIQAGLWKYGSFEFRMGDVARRRWITPRCTLSPDPSSRDEST